MKFARSSVFELVAGFLVVTFTACSATPIKNEALAGNVFADLNCDSYQEALTSEVQSIFGDEISNGVLEAKKDYEGSRFLPNGKIYGASIQNVVLTGKKAEQIEAEMNSKSCRKKVTEIKDPKTNQPILGKDGKPSPMWIYLCDDGGFVRIKPEGDPANKYIPQPHGSKGLRYPFDSKFESFADEVLKVNESGRALPKWPKDMRRVVAEDAAWKEFVNCWSKDVHFDLAK